MEANVMWERYCRYLCVQPSIGLKLDVSRMKFGATYFESMDGPARRALDAMHKLEQGEIANPDENRQVGHYWLRNPSLAPKDLKGQIEECIASIKAFSASVHQGKLRPEKAERFRTVLLIGIGGSALGPQLADAALSSSKDPMRIRFFDNTDPDGMDHVLSDLGASGLAETLVLVVSKSGGTKETRNGMLETKQAFAKAGLNFGKHAVAVTQAGSQLDQVATADGWLARFPMWDWVGGRTSQTSAVGLLPAALQGFDIDDLVAGARDCDQVTRSAPPLQNPSMLLALMWLHAGSSGASKDMVVLPYKDRLGLFSRYLQQLIMESLGKDRDLKGNVARHGISVYGNKGSTDQHAFVQQLREGINNFFVTFLQVDQDRQGPSMEVEPGITSGDYLLGFFLGTRKALFDNDRESITISIDAMSARSLGVLIALFERAVGFYASLVGINAYHQPGVEAGKKAASEVIALQRKAMDYLGTVRGKAQSLADIARNLGAELEVETLFQVLEHLSVNEGRGLVRVAGKNPFSSTYLLR